MDCGHHCFRTAFRGLCSLSRVLDRAVQRDRLSWLSKIVRNASGVSGGRFKDATADRSSSLDQSYERHAVKRVRALFRQSYGETLSNYAGASNAVFAMVSPRGEQPPVG
jgi:hypothetical protein